eukprot:m.227558 g.227558  ORF g.227558 m.227558 type:complete len:255 (+) comp17247_c0_seq1:170-934(+)
MKINTRLTIAFIFCIFEFSSLGFLSLEPSRLILNNYFPRGNATDGDSDKTNEKFFDNAAEQGFAFTDVGWSVAFGYVGLLFLIMGAYVVVFIKELGYGCLCTADRYQRANRHCCTRACGKSFLLMWFLFPIHTACLLFIVYWDIKELNKESQEVDDIRLDHHEFLTNIAFFFGDLLLLKHVLAKWKALRTRDLRVSLFLETHVHLDDDDGHDHSRSRTAHAQRIIDSDPGLVESAPLLPRGRSTRSLNLNVDIA